MFIAIGKLHDIAKAAFWGRKWNDWDFYKLSYRLLWPSLNSSTLLSSFYLVSYPNYGLSVVNTLNLFWWAARIAPLESDENPLYTENAVVLGPVFVFGTLSWSYYFDTFFFWYIDFYLRWISNLFKFFCVGAIGSILNLCLRPESIISPPSSNSSLIFSSIATLPFMVYFFKRSSLFLNGLTSD